MERGDIERLFRNQLDKISDAGLRKKVTNAWFAACELGGWESVDELLKIPFTLLTETEGINLIEHTIAVTEGAYGLAKAQIESYLKQPYKIDLDRVVAGGLLHDVGKLLETEPDGSGGHRKSRRGKCLRHPISGAMLAAEQGLSIEIQNTIACHAKEGEGRPQVVETVLVYQADFATFNPLVMKSRGTLIE